MYFHNNRSSGFNFSWIARERISAYVVKLPQVHIGLERGSLQGRCTALKPIYDLSVSLPIVHIVRTEYRNYK